MCSLQIEIALALTEVLTQRKSSGEVKILFPIPRNGTEPSLSLHYDNYIEIVIARRGSEDGAAPPSPTEPTDLPPPTNTTNLECRLVKKHSLSGDRRAHNRSGSVRADFKRGEEARVAQQEIAGNGVVAGRNGIRDVLHLPRCAMVDRCGAVVGVHAVAVRRIRRRFIEARRDLPVVVSRNDRIALETATTGWRGADRVWKTEGLTAIDRFRH
jgi:hypothetical protein